MDPVPLAWNALIPILDVVLMLVILFSDKNPINLVSDTKPSA